MMNLEKSKGITLIALVITVIILLILAAVAVSAITGNDGLFSKANEAGTKYNESAQNEKKELDGLLSWFGDLESGNPNYPKDADFIIETIEDLITFRDKVNAGNDFEGKKVYLVADLDLTSIDNFEGIGSFSGTFDGMLHKITNLKIEQFDKKFVGFFERITDNGIVKRLILENVTISNTMSDQNLTAGAIYTAGIAGVSTGIIEKCANVGGTVNCRLTSPTATNWFNSYAAGIVASLNGKNAIVDQCYNTSNISASSPKTSTYFGSEAGGIVAWNYSTITNCYNTGTVYAESSNAYSGGITGVNSPNKTAELALIKNSYNVGSATAKSANFQLVGSLVGCEYYNNTYTNCYILSNTVGAKLSTSEEVVYGITKLSVADLQRKADDLGKYFVSDDTNINNGYPILSWQIGEEINEKEYRTEIRTIADLINFRDSVNAGDTYLDKNVFLMNDLDLSNIENFECIGNFEGTFDGLGHVIKNLTMSRKDEPNVGLFRVLLTKGVIKNLSLNNANISTEISANNNTTSVKAGGISAVCYGRIENCANVDGTVTCNVKEATINDWYSSNAGGITAILLASADNINKATISSCYNTSNITATIPKNTSYYSSVVGGLVGWNYSSIVNSYNKGNSYGEGYSSYVGGLNGIHSTSTTGYNSYCINSYTTGNVTGTGNSSSTIFAGNISGISYSTGFYTNCFAISNGKVAVLNSSRKEITSGISKVTVDVLKTKANDLGRVFKNDENNVNGGYPILEWQ